MRKCHFGPPFKRSRNATASRFTFSPRPVLRLMPLAYMASAFWRGRAIEVRPALLFTNYVFVLIVAQWHIVNSTLGVRRLICDGGRPARVPDHVIEVLRAREGPDGLIRLPAKPPPRGWRKVSASLSRGAHSRGSTGFTKGKRHATVFGSCSRSWARCGRSSSPARMSSGRASGGGGGVSRARPPQRRDYLRRNQTHSPGTDDRRGAGSARA